MKKNVHSHRPIFLAYMYSSREQVELSFINVLYLILFPSFVIFLSSFLCLGRGLTTG
jgi:hypothetical protein